ncbi:hypothetical protein J1614_008428, partial [Plenodomus biglobosus]
MTIRRCGAYDVVPQLHIKEVTSDQLVDLAVMIGIVHAIVAQKQRCEGHGFFNSLHNMFELKWIEDSSIGQLA